MDPKDLKRILDALKEADVHDFSLETPDYKLAVKRGGEIVHVAAPAPVVMPAAPVYAAPPVVAAPAPTPVVAAAPVTASPTPEPAPVAVPASSRGHTVKAPIVGTFYRASSPDVDPFVEIGTRVEVGQVLCIIEAMKLMNEIEAEVGGVVREILVSNAQPVEYGQPLFVIE